MILLCIHRQPTKIEQDRQSKYHVTLRRICVTIFAVEQQ